MNDETQSATDEPEQQLNVDQPEESGDLTDGNDTPEQSPDEQTQQSRSQNSKQRLKRKLGESERRNVQLAEQLNTQQQSINTLETKLDGVINPPAVRPERVNYETEEDYEDALYDFRQPVKSQPVPDEKPISSNPARQLVTQDVHDNWLDQIDLAIEKHPDFKKKLEAIPFQHMTDAMTASIMESESAGELAYFLGCNLSETDRISKLSMAGQIREIDKLSNKFKSTTSNAPTPIDPMKGSDSPVVDVDKMSMKDYAAYMNKKQFGGP